MSETLPGEEQHYHTNPSESSANIMDGDPGPWSLIIPALQSD